MKFRSALFTSNSNNPVKSYEADGKHRTHRRDVDYRQSFDRESSTEETSWETMGTQEIGYDHMNVTVADSNKNQWQI